MFQLNKVNVFVYICAYSKFDACEIFQKKSNKKNSKCLQLCHITFPFNKIQQSFITEDTNCCCESGMFPHSHFSRPV